MVELLFVTPGLWCVPSGTVKLTDGAEDTQEEWGFGFLYLQH